MGAPDTIGARIRPPRIRGLVRERVDGLLDQVWKHRLTLLLAPAGSGKTTALAQFTARSPDPVLWYGADDADGAAESMLAHLARAFRDAFGDLRIDTSSAPTLAASLEAWDGESKVAIAVDDLHAIRGSSAETAIEQLIRLLPSSFRIVVATRTAPSFDLTRLRLSGDLLEIGADDLRFRTWETEQLFREVYQSALPPEDMARLTGRVEGWAAGLQLFHLASRGKSIIEQRSLIDIVNSRSRLAREYLARHVLDTVDSELRQFLIDTCVLGVMSAVIANEYRDRSDSGARLAELEAGSLFMIPLDELGTYRLHEVLRSHLEVLLTERDGESAVRRAYQRAAVTMERHGHMFEALRCYGKGAAWDDVQRLVGRHHGALRPSLSWLDSLPAAIIDGDPWLMLGRARAAVVAGRIDVAICSYSAAEGLYGDTRPAHTCRQERLDVLGWIDPSAPRPRGWQAVFYGGLRSNPVTAGSFLSGLGTTDGWIAAGALALLAGDLHQARRCFEEASLVPDPSEFAGPLTALGLALTELLARRTPCSHLVDEAEAAAERAGHLWLARLARATQALTGRSGADDGARAAVAQADADGDRWGAAIAALLGGLGRLLFGQAPVERLEEARDRFRALEATLPESVALAGLGLAMRRRGLPAAHTVALSADHLARNTGSDFARSLAMLALGAEHHGEAEELAGTGGFALPIDAAVGCQGCVGQRDSATLSARCFGAFVLYRDHQHVDLRPLKPRARSALRLLALHGGRGVHRELLIEALWPDSPAEAGLRGLQVAVSSVRHALTMAGCARDVVDRDAATYRLRLDATDLLDFQLKVDAANRLALSDQPNAAAAAAQGALELYTDDLLIEEGPVDWVVRERERCRLDAAAMAQLCAEREMSAGNPSSAAHWCERGLRVDRYRDRLWKILIRARNDEGDRAGAVQARCGYEAMIEELGVSL